MAKNAAQIIVSLIDNASGPARKIAAALREIQGSKTTQAARKLGVAQKELSTSSHAVTASFGPQAKAITATATAMGAAAAPARKVAKANREVAASFDASGNAIQRHTKVRRYALTVAEKAERAERRAVALAEKVERVERRAARGRRQSGDDGGGLGLGAGTGAPRAPRGGRSGRGRGRGVGSNFDGGVAPTGGGRRGASVAQATAPAGGNSIMPGAGGVIGAVVGYQALKKSISSTVGEAISFEKAMAEVKKKVDAPSSEAFASLERGIKQASKDLGIAQNEVAALTAEAGASGVAFGDLDRFIKLASKASVGWDVTPQDASEKLAKIKAAGNLTIGEMETLGDKINALGDNSAAKERDIVEMFSRSGAAAKEAGVDYDTTLALLTSVNSAGMQPEIASRWFNAFSGGLRTASEDNDDMVAGLKTLGLTTKDVSEGMKRDAGKTMIDLFDRLSKSPDAANAAIKMFGKGWWDESLRAKAAGAEIQKQLDLVRNPGRYNGSLDKGLQIQLGTTARHLEQLSALSADVGDRMGRWALPPINKTIESVLKGVDDLERRFKVMNAGKGPDSDSDQTGRFVRSIKDAAGSLIDKGLDTFVAPLPTADPARQSSAKNAEIARDQKILADKRRAEADLLDVQRAKANKADKKLLTEKAAKLRLEADAAQSISEGATRTAAVSGARDMTDVEVGDAAAKRSVQIQREARGLEAALAGGKGKNVSIPGSGVVMAREAAQAALDAIRVEMTSGPGKVETITPAPAALPSMKVPLPPDRPAGIVKSPPAGTPLPPARPASVDRNRPLEVSLPEEAVTAPALPPAAPPPAIDAGKIAEATAALATYKGELAGINTQLAGLQASGEAAFSPDASGLESRKAEVEAIIDGLKAKIESLNTTTIKPQADGSGLGTLDAAADVTKGKLAEVGGISVSPTVDTGSINAAIAAATQLKSILASIPGAASTAGAAVGQAKVAGASATSTSTAGGAARQIARSRQTSMTANV